MVTYYSYLLLFSDMEFSRPYFESLGLGLGFGIVFWQLNKFGIIMLILKCKLT